MTNLSHFVDVNVAALATDAGYFAKLPATNIIEPAISLLAYHDDFYRVLGRDASAEGLGSPLGSVP